MIKFFKKMFDKRNTNIKMTGESELVVLKQIAAIPNIEDYFKLQKISGYELYGKTKKEKYLGVVEFSNSMLSIIDHIKNQKEERDYEKVDNGYKSMV